MRLLADWVESFMDLTEHLPSPSIFRRWAAISAVAGALERKVWIRSLNMDLYPNLYVVLTGPPGVGKSVILALTEELWRGTSTIHVAPKSVSKASLIDSLNDAKRTKTIVQEKSLYLDFNSLAINAGELGVLIPQYDPDFMNILTDIYDCRTYEEKRRNKDLHITIKKPQLNIIAGTTPSYLNQTLPEGAWDQGFLSRTFLIFSGDTTLVDIFGDETTDEDKFSKLRSDFRDIHEMAGPMGFADDARTAMREWHLNGGPPKPEHPKLVHYSTRRSAHLLKLCMVACAARGGDKIITLRDFQTALNWLMEAEAIMPDIFKALGASSDSKVMEETTHFIYKLFMMTKDPVAERRVINFVSERVPSYNVMKIIEIMISGGRIEKGITKGGELGYIPRTIQNPY